MSWVQIVWPMLAGASLVLGLIHALLWLRQRTLPEHLAFAFAATSLAALTLLELQALDAATPERLAALIRWMHVPVTTLVLSLVAFLRLSFGPRFFGLAATAAMLRVAGLVLNFGTGANLNFATLSVVGRVAWAGDVVVSYPIGTPNPWVLVGQLSNLLLAAYVVMILSNALRSGDKRARTNVIVICLGWLVFIGLMVTAALVMTLNAVRTPFIGSPSFLFVIAAMSYQLTWRLFESNRLAAELQVSEIDRLRDRAELSERREQVAHLARVTMLGELSGSLAHELNQPLSAILSNAQAAQRMLQRDPGELEEIGLILGDIVENDRRAGEIIRRLRAMLRKDPRTLERLDLNEVIRESLRLLEQDLRNRQVKVVLVLSPDLPSVEADRVQIQQVILNLLINACDAMAASTRRQLTIRSAHDGQHVRVSVLDEGTGIAESELSRIFEPFLTTKPSGLGLGLAICRTIVESHKGRLWAENLRAAPGACFRFELPIVR